MRQTALFSVFSSPCRHISAGATGYFLESADLFLQFFFQCHFENSDSDSTIFRHFAGEVAGYLIHYIFGMAILERRFQLSLMPPIFAIARYFRPPPSSSLHRQLSKPSRRKSHCHAVRHAVAFRFSITPRSKCAASAATPRCFSRRASRLPRLRRRTPPVAWRRRRRRERGVLPPRASYRVLPRCTQRFASQNANRSFFSKRPPFQSPDFLRFSILFAFLSAAAAARRFLSRLRQRHGRSYGRIWRNAEAEAARQREKAYSRMQEIFHYASTHDMKCRASR